MYTSIRPGQVWLDTNGNRIHAHGGSILTVGDTFYWYGENKAKDLYIALADRWLVDLPKELPDIGTPFLEAFATEPPDWSTCNTDLR